MEPVREEGPMRVQSPYAGQEPFSQTTPKDTVYRDKPSLKYKDINQAMGNAIYKQSHNPPSPTLPRRQTAKTWNATMKERNPLASSLTGAGRAGKFGELTGESGGHYQGEVLAGRPHGHGYYRVQKGPGLFELQYEGEWVQGRREGLGTRYYHNHESYSGQFVANIRHGFGRFFFGNGDVYAGEWVDDRRTGRGTLYYSNGDIFVGDFVRDKQEGLGALFMMQRQRKYVAEYVNGAPTCGTMLEIENSDLEPLQGQLITLALHKKLENANNGIFTSDLPAIDLQQPHKVLGEQFIAVRKTRANSQNKEIRAMQNASGSLQDKEMDMLRHSFSLLAGGDNAKCSLPPHQLRELCVMAGLDPAAPATHALVEAMLARKNAAGRISFDACMQVVCHYQVKVDSDESMPEEMYIQESAPEQGSAVFEFVNTGDQSQYMAEAEEAAAAGQQEENPEEPQPAEEGDVGEKLDSIRE